MKPLIILILAIAATGCAPYQITSKFDPQELVPYQQKGTATVKGQAFLKTRGGDVKYGAGNTVTLQPATPYVNAVMNANEEHFYYVDPHTIDDRWDDFKFTTQADAQGNFEFTGLPAGDYYLNCKITWYVPSLIVPNTTGGEITKKITVRDGETQRVMLTE